MTSIGNCRLVRRLQLKRDHGAARKPYIPVAATALILLLSACASKPEATARTPAVCEGLRPDLPIAYHGKTDAPDTILRIRKVNSRFQAMCG